MRTFRRPRRTGQINTWAAVILGLATLGIAGGLWGAHRVRQRQLVGQALQAGRAAIQRQDWDEACKQLRYYLDRRPEDLGVLAQYADANLAVRPVQPQNVAAAAAAYRTLLRRKPGDEALSTRLAVLYFQFREYAEVIHVCQQRLDQEPGDGRFRMWMAEALMAQRDFDAAEQHLQALLDDPEQGVRAAGLLSHIASSRERPDSDEVAGALLDQAIEKFPNSGEAFVQRARFQRLMRLDAAAARSDLQAASRLDPNRPGVLLSLAEEWLELGEVDLAAAVMDKLDRMTADDLRKLDIDPEAFRVQTFRVAGRLLLAQQRYEEGAELASRTLQDLPAYQHVLCLPQVIELYLAAKLLEQAEEALEAYRAAMEWLPAEDHPQARAQCTLFEAALLREQGKPHAAIVRLEELLVRHPDLDRGRLLLWELYRATGQPARAVNSLANYVRMQPNDGVLNLALADAWRGRNWSRVVQHATAAEPLLADPLPATLLRLEAAIQLAANSRLRQMQPLRQELDALKALHPRKPEVRLLQAAIDAQDDQLETAVQRLEGALQECDENLQVRLNLSEYYQRLGRIERAMEVCRDAAQAHPQSAAPRIREAQILAADGRPDEAAALLQAAAGQLEGMESEYAAYALVQQQLRQGRRSEAIVLLARLAEQHPHDLQPVLTLLALPEVQTDAAASEKWIERLRAIEGPGGLHTGVQQAKLWLRTDAWRSRHAEIQRVLEEAAIRAPGWAEPVIALGWLHARTGDHGRREQLLRKFVEAHPEELEAASELLVLLEREQRFAEAASVLDRLPSPAPGLNQHRANIAVGLGDFPAAIEALRRTVAADPANAGARVILAKILYEQEGKASESLRLLDEADSLVADLPAAVAVRVRILAREGRTAEAEALLDARVAEGGGRMVDLLLRAEYWTSAGQLQRAEEDYRRMAALPDAPAEGAIQLAMFFSRTGRPREALDACRAGLERDPENLTLRRLLAAGLLSGTDPQEWRRARELLEELMAAHPDDVELMTLNAQALLRSGEARELARAQELLERAVTAEPRNLGAHELLIRLAGDRGDYREVNRLLARAVSAHPENVGLRLLQARLERDSGNPTLAHELARAVLQGAPDSVEARNLLSELALEEGRLDEARQLNREALQLNPSDPPARLIAARICAVSGQRDEAIAILEAALSDETPADRVMLLVALARLHLGAGAADRAAPYVAQALQERPAAREVRKVRFELLGAQKQYEALLAELEGVTPQIPGAQVLLVAGASVLVASGRDELIDHARQVFEKAITFDDQEVIPHLGAARTCYQLRLLDQAQAHYRRVLELSPHHPMALNDLAWLLGEDLGRPQEGLELADKGVNRHPHHVHLLDTRGVLLARLGRYEDARAAFSQALAVQNVPFATQARIRLHLGDVCVQHARDADCRRALSEAAAIDGEHKVLTPEERARLAGLIESINAES